MNNNIWQMLDDLDPIVVEIWQERDGQSYSASLRYGELVTVRHHVYNCPTRKRAISDVIAKAIEMKDGI